MVLAVVVVLGCLALATRAYWPRTTADRALQGSGRALDPAQGPCPGGRGDLLDPATGYRRHRWSGRRSRLELTPGGIRQTGRAIRFCLDCPAEKSDER